MVYSNWALEGDTFTIITVLQLPPSESFSKRVSFESYMTHPVPTSTNYYSIGDEKALLVFIAQSVNAVG